MKRVQVPLDDRVGLQAPATIGQEPSRHEAPAPRTPPLERPAALIPGPPLLGYGDGQLAAVAGATLQTRAAVLEGTAVIALAAVGRLEGAHGRPQPTGHRPDALGDDPTGGAAAHRCR
jgi:hypothetical protein